MKRSMSSAEQTSSPLPRLVTSELTPVRAPASIRPPSMNKMQHELFRQDRLFSRKTQ